MLPPHMILIHSDLINSDFALFMTLTAATLLALLVGIGFHEFCHAFTTDSLGDDLPASQGRVTLNPLAHLDPAGTLMMLFIGFGWGKPVQFNPYAHGLKTSPKAATLLVSLAGPLSNFVVAGLLAVPIRLDLVPYINPFSRFIFGLDGAGEYIGVFLSAAVFLNCILGVFNLIPIHPLDGFKVVLGILPDELSNEWAKLAQYGPPALLVLIVLSYFGGYSPLSEIMVPSVSWLVQLFTGVNT